MPLRTSCACSQLAPLRQMQNLAAKRSRLNAQVHASLCCHSPPAPAAMHHPAPKLELLRQGPTSVLLPGAQAHAHRLSSCAFSCFCSSDNRILPAYPPPACTAGEGERPLVGGGRRRQRQRQAEGPSAHPAALSGVRITAERVIYLQRALTSRHSEEAGACARCRRLQRWIGGAREFCSVADLRSGRGAPMAT